MCVPCPIHLSAVFRHVMTRYFVSSPRYHHTHITTVTDYLELRGSKFDTDCLTQMHLDPWCVFCFIPLGYHLIPIIGHVRQMKMYLYFPKSFLQLYCCSKYSPGGVWLISVHQSETTSFILTTIYLLTLDGTREHTHPVLAETLSFFENLLCSHWSKVVRVKLHSDMSRCGCFRHLQ